MNDKTYNEMFEEAVNVCDKQGDGCYYFDGYTGVNALSMYVYDKYDVNAANDTAAHEALCAAQ